MVKQQQGLLDGVPSYAPVIQSASFSVSVSGRSRKCARPRKRLTRAQVVKMLSQKQAEPESEGGGGSSGASGTLSGNDSGSGGSGAVTPGGISNGEGSKEFLSTGRTGRRNALPDILGQHADTDTADLPNRLEALTTEPKLDRSTGVVSQDGASTSQQHTG